MVPVREEGRHNVLDWRPPTRRRRALRSFTDVHDDLTARSVPHEIVHLPSSSRPAQLAAEALGVPVGKVIKSLLFLLDDVRPVRALVTGDATVDDDTLAHETDAVQIRLARGREVRELTPYKPGAVPPCALRAPRRRGPTDGGEPSVQSGHQRTKWRA
jgi:prolyl-tRNA editing enzyme YbaK/EbsC (Cys-tRNA(Pro) deacylase)